MNTHTAHHAFGFGALRHALHLPQRAAPAPTAAGAVTQGWMARLAAWAERQPVHHRMGSYTRR